MKLNNKVIILIVLIGIGGACQYSVHRSQMTVDEFKELNTPVVAKTSTGDHPQGMPMEQPLFFKNYLIAEDSGNNFYMAPHIITVGWHFDSHTERAPRELTNILFDIDQFVINSNDHFAIETVDLDVPRNELSKEAARVTGLGIALDGSSLFTVNGVVKDFSGNPGEGIMTRATVRQGLTETIDDLTRVKS